MSIVITAGTVLLVSSDPKVRKVIRLERGSCPLLYADSLDTCYRYLEKHKDADLIYLDSVLIRPNTLLSVETKLSQLMPGVKIGYLFSNTEDLSRLALPANALFRKLESS